MPATPTPDPLLPDCSCGGQPGRDPAAAILDLDRQAPRRAAESARLHWPHDVMLIAIISPRRRSPVQ
jgi:hypothetical protein